MWDVSNWIFVPTLGGVSMLVSREMYIRVFDVMFAHHCRFGLLLNC